MKKIFFTVFWGICLLLLTGCEELDSLSANLDQSFVDGIMSNLEINKHVEVVIPSGSSVYLFNMDEQEGDTWATFLDSKLADQLAGSRVVLLERNPKKVEKILQERVNKSYSVYYEETKLANMINRIVIDDIDVKDLLDKDVMAFLEKDRNNVYLVPTHLKPAEYVISYRILDAQLKYSYHESPWLVSFYNSTLGAVGNFVNSAVREIDHTINIKRQGNLTLQLNITNTKTGEIVYAKNVRSYYSDVFKGDDRLNYKDFSYSFIAPTKKKTILDKGQSILSVGYKAKGTSKHLAHVNYDMVSSIWFSAYYDQDFVNKLQYIGLKYGIPLQFGANSALIPFVGLEHSTKTNIKYGIDLYYRLFNMFQLGFSIESNSNGDILNNGDKSVTLKWLLD